MQQNKNLRFKTYEAPTYQMPRQYARQWEHKTNKTSNSTFKELMAKRQTHELIMII